ncbi:hypothetical protein J4461_04170 [Candidatus Pacearchaeota archaeon]|nr:hypothetical protein [Candidatus Pacearchaeota archaeon]
MNVKNLVLGIGIFVVYLLMLNYGIEAFYPSPQYNDFCTPGSEFERSPVKPYPVSGDPNCTFSSKLREQEQQCYAQEGQPIYEYNERGCALAVRECDLCNKEYNDARQAHAKVVFIIALIAGIITLLLGFLVLSMEPVGSALMASGVGAIFYGSVRNWENLSDIWRFLLLLLSLVLLIWIALRLNSQKKKSWQFWKK